MASPALACLLGLNQTIPDMNLHTTFAYDKWSCDTTMWYWHIVTCYLVFLTGIACMITRVIQSIKWTHVWFGRGYIISMILAQSTALVIHVHGLPLGVLYSFIWVLGGLITGWILIKFHQADIEAKAFAIVNANIQQGTYDDTHTLAAAVGQAKGQVANSKTRRQRMCSYKALHGAVMFTSWMNITGRIFASDQSPGSFACDTHPVWKPGNRLGEEPYTFVATSNPHYDDLPWANWEVGWMIVLFVGPMAFAYAVGYAWVRFNVKEDSRLSLTSTSTGGYLPPAELTST